MKPGASWRQVKLKDVCTRITVGHVGPMVDEYVADGIPFLRSQNIQAFRLDLKDVKFIPRAFHETLKKCVLHPGDVAVIRTGYPGTACVIPDSLPEANCADLVVITPSTALDPYYLAAVFNSAWGVATVAGNLVGAAQQHFNVGAAKEMLFPLPALETQRRIAGILSAYDDLIENCQRRIGILEEMARGLYREWFVNFRFPGHEKAQFVESSMGRIPKGWEVKHIKELARVIYGAPFKSSHFNSEGRGLPVVRIRDIPPGRSQTFTDEKFAPESVIENGDVLVGMDGDFHMGIWTAGPALQNQRVARLRASAEMSNLHLLLAVEGEIQAFNKSIVGTTVAHLGDMHIKTIRVPWPPGTLCATAKSHFEPMLDEFIVLKQKVTILRATRDLLLPRLLSGELSVSDAA